MQKVFCLSFQHLNGTQADSMILWHRVLYFLSTEKNTEENAKIICTSLITDHVVVKGRWKDENCAGNLRVRQVCILGAGISHHFENYCRRGWRTKISMKQLPHRKLMENCPEKSFHQEKDGQGRKKIHKDAATKGRVLKELLLHVELLVHI